MVSRGLAPAAQAALIVDDVLAVSTVSLAVAVRNYDDCLTLIADEYPHFDLASLTRDLCDPRSLSLDRIPISVVTQNVNTVSRHLHEPLLGVKVVDRIEHASSRVLQLLKHLFPYHRDNACLGEMIIFLSNYFAAITESIQIRLSWKNNMICMGVTPCSPDLSRHQLEGAMLGIKSVLYYLTRRSPEKVLFEHSAACDPEDYRAFFHVTPQFESTGNALHYRAEQRYSVIDDISINAIKGLSLIFVEEFPELDFVDRCQRILKSILHFGSPSRERVSGMMQISVSTLQRKLKLAGTSFKSELLELRKEMATDFLRNQQLTATQTAFLLGYQSEAQFFKAFKVWFGLTPGEFRKQGIEA